MQFRVFCYLVPIPGPAKFQPGSPSSAGSFFFAPSVRIFQPPPPANKGRPEPNQHHWHWTAPCGSNLPSLGLFCVLTLNKAERYRHTAMNTAPTRWQTRSLTQHEGWSHPLGQRDPVRVFRLREGRVDPPEHPGADACSGWTTARDWSWCVP